MISFKLYPSEVEEDRLEIMIIEKIYPLIQDNAKTDGTSEYLKSNRNKLNSSSKNQSMKSPSKMNPCYKDPNSMSNHSDNLGNTPGKISIVGEKWENSDKYTQDLIIVLQDKQMVEMLGCIHKSLYPIYVLYGDANN